MAQARHELPLLCRCGHVRGVANMVAPRPGFRFVCYCRDCQALARFLKQPDVLDTALLRPGRFDRRVVVSRPDVRGREEILRVHTRKIPLAEDVDLSVLARGTPGFSGADLANMVN